MSYNVVISADFGAANTGLTVYGKLFDTAGAQVGSTITTGFAEAVAGLYVYVLAAPDGQEGVFVAYDSANTALRRVAVIAPRETENPDVKTSTRGTSTLTTGDIDARLAAYDAPTKAELDAAQSSIEDTIADEIAALGATVTVTVLSVINGNSITLYRSDTWHFTMTLAGVVLTDYDALAFSVKESVHQSDSSAVMLLRSDTGLQRMGGAAPVSSSNGTLTIDSATALTIDVAITETTAATVGDLQWWLKGFVDADDEGFTLATGHFAVYKSGIEATS